MNKNPFLPAPNFTPQQPPLPPGPPPPQPNQADYSAWWAGASAQQQHIQPPSGGPYNPQWTAAQPSRPSAEQSALYANYGYGTQNNHWQRQQQQQQQYHPPPQVIQQQPPPPPSQPSYNPYQPTAGYAQPYAPSGPAPPQPMVQGTYPHPSAQPQQIMFAPPMPPQQPQQHHHQQQPQQMQPRHHHGSPQHPPAKRQRFDGPSGNNRHHQPPHHHHQPPQPQFQPPPAPPQTAGSFSGSSSRGGPPSGPSGRGGGVPLGPGGRGGNAGSRGGRGGSMSGTRGAMGGGRGRGGSFSGGSSAGRAGTGAGPPSGPMRGGSRSNFSGGNKDFQNRRGSFGGGSYQGQSFRGRNQMGSNRGHRNDGGGGGGYGARENTQMSGYSGKKDENRRTLTDFKVIGLAIPDLTWTWGTVPSASSVKTEDRNAEVDAAIGSNVVIKDEIREGGNDLVSSSAIEEKQPEVKTETFVVDAVMAEAQQLQEPLARIVPSDTSAVLPPPSRIRIYFHTPVTADDSRPIPHNSSFGEVPSDARKGKRKKLEDDDGDLEERRVPPPPQRGGTMNDDQSSVGASVDPSIAETASEADWLMAAIVDGEEEAEAAGAHDFGDEDDGSGPLHISHIVKGHEHEMPVDDDHVTGNEEGVLGGTSHNDDDVNMAGQVEHNLRELTTLEGKGQTPIKSTSGVANCNDGNLLSLHPNGDHSAATKPPSVDALNHPGHTDVESAMPEISISSVSFSSSQNEDLASESVADRPEFSEKQFSSQQSPQFRPKSLEAVSADSTLLDLDANEATQTENSQMTQIIETQPEHLPELALSSTQPSISSATALEDRSAPSSTKTEKGPKTPSANRLSISYARGNRRLVLDAEVVESLKLYRQEGRIDVVIKLTEDGDERFKGILMEGLSEVTKSYSPLSAPFDPPADSDPSVPPFWKISVPSTLHLTVYLDTVRPLSEPKWAKTGDIQDWLKSILGRMFWAAGDAAEGWEKKIQVVDPDPPPTIWTVLDGWSTNSPVGAPNERQRFLKTHMTEIDNILEILLRLVRGERATAFSQSTPTISAPSISGPLLSALTQGSAHSAQQTHVSLAVLAMFQLAMDYAQKALGEKGKTEAEEHIGEIIRCLPSHLIYKSLDGIFKEWRVEKKGR